MQSAVKCDCEFIPHPITPFPPPPKKKKKEKRNESLVFAIEIFKRQALFFSFF